MNHKHPLQMNARERRSLKRANARLLEAARNSVQLTAAYNPGEVPEIRKPMQAYRNLAPKGALSGKRCSA